MSQVVKLVIEAYPLIDCMGTSMGAIQLQVNPESISFEYGITFGDSSKTNKSDGNGGGSFGGQQVAAGESSQILGLRAVFATLEH